MFKFSQYLFFIFYIAYAHDSYAQGCQAACTPYKSGDSHLSYEACMARCNGASGKESEAYISGSLEQSQLDERNAVDAQEASARAKEEAEIAAAEAKRKWLEAIRRAENEETAQDGTPFGETEEQDKSIEELLAEAEDAEEKLKEATTTEEEATAAAAEAVAIAAEVERQCQTAINAANSNCLNKNDPKPGSSTPGTGSAAACKTAKNKIEQILPKSVGLENNCRSSRTNLNSNCDGSTSLSGAVSILLPRLNTKINSLNSQNSSAQRAIKELNQCIASLKSTTPPVAGTNPPPTTPPPGNNPPDPIAPGSQGSDNPPGGGELGGLGEIASGIGSLFNSGDDSGSSESASTSSEATKLRVNDTRANNSQFTAPSLSRNSLSLDGGGGLGGADGIGDPDLSRDTTPNNSQFTQNGGNSNNNNNNAQRSPTGGGFAGTRGGGNFGAANRAGGSGPTNRGTRRSASSTKTRNIISGYKKVKPSDGGGSLAIKPSAFKRYGKAGLKTKLKTARKKFGKDVPLIFKNGQFVLDFLALKEKKGFKSRQAAMETYWRGQGKAGAGSREGTSFEACNPNECHQNPNLNMFKIMNFRFQKQFNNVKTQDI